MWPQWTSMLSLGQWALLALVPPAIVALYFLKLKRQPLEVPSTYLWHKSIEDLHVNSIWQRLRQSLLLFLQLLLVALLMFTLLRPSWQASKLSGGRYIFMVDTSASMGAKDVEPSRLEEAKKRVGQLIDEMRSGDVAMIISFSDTARVEQSFTDNRNELRRRLAAIKQTDRSTSLAEALRVASGLANPGRSAADTTDYQVAEAMPAKLFIFSDGKFPDVKDFSLGHLTPQYVPIGRRHPANVAVAAFTTARNEERADRLQAFGRLENHGPEEVEVDVTLSLDGELQRAARLQIPPGESAGWPVDLEEVEEGTLELRAEIEDSLLVDNLAWTTIGKPKRSKVLLVTPGNEPLSFALATDRAGELVDATEHSPDFLALPDYREAAATGGWDLVIYDRCLPEQMPQANTLFIGQLPPGDAWKAGDKVNVPQIIDTERTHPLMQLLDMGDVLIAEGTPLFAPPGATVLIDTDVGALFAIAPREGYEDAVLGFELIGQENVGSNWPVKPSFPVFMLNVLDYLGGGRAARDGGSVRPGQAVTWRSDTGAEQIQVRTPSGKTLPVSRGSLNTYTILGTSEVGVYEVREEKGQAGKFAVNLFNSQESNLAIRPRLTIGDTKVAGDTVWEASRRDLWKFLLLAALAVLLLEWYIYNRRVYV
jgi:hypothetical protein